MTRGERKLWNEVQDLITNDGWQSVSVALPPPITTVRLRMKNGEEVKGSYQPAFKSFIKEPRDWPRPVYRGKVTHWKYDGPEE